MPVPGKETRKAGVGSWQEDNIIWIVFCSDVIIAVVLFQKDRFVGTRIISLHYNTQTILNVHDAVFDSHHDTRER
jgi:hypothetical protein